MKQFILKLPEDTALENLSEETLIAIKSVGGDFPDGAIVNSQAVDGYELKLVMARATTEAIENLIFILGLDWEVLAEEGVESDPLPILDFMLDKAEFNEDEEQIGATPFDIKALQTYAGKAWLWV